MNGQVFGFVVSCGDHVGVTDRDQSNDLLAAVRSLRDEIDTVVLPMDVDGVDEARIARRDMLRHLDDYVLPRLADMDAPLLAVVGGSTGAGKSTLVNTLAKHVVSRSGVLRPTTRASVLVHHPTDTRWFVSPRILPGLARTSGLQGPHEDPSSVRLVTSTGLPPGVALLDAPDIDSVVATNRDLARQLLSAADLWIFVTTAARYADAVPWELLRQARERGTAVAVVLDRVPGEAADAIGEHLGEMLVEQGLPHAPVFTIVESTLDDEGLLADGQIAELREWLTRLGEDSRARGLVVRRTLTGALDALNTRVDDLADASSAQAQTVEQLRAIVAIAYREAVDEVSRGVSDGTLLRGEVLARWQEYVGTGEIIKQVEATVSRLRDRLTAAVTGRPAPASDLTEALQSGVAQLITASAQSAALTVTRRWRSVPGGAAVVLANPAASRPSDDLPERVEALVRDWQDDILELVRSEGKDRRTTARVMSYGVNAVGVILMFVVFSHTAGVTGAEVGVAGGAAVVAQRILEAIFGDQAVRTLAEKARALLVSRTEAVYLDERARLEALLGDVDVDLDQPERLRKAAAAVKASR